MALSGLHLCEDEFSRLSISRGNKNSGCKRSYTSLPDWDDIFLSGLSLGDLPHDQDECKTIFLLEDERYGFFGIAAAFEKNGDICLGKSANEVDDYVDEEWGFYHINNKRNNNKNTFELARDDPSYQGRRLDCPPRKFASIMNAFQVAMYKYSNSRYQQNGGWWGHCQQQEQHTQQQWCRQFFNEIANLLVNGEVETDAVEHIENERIAAFVNNFCG